MLGMGWGQLSKGVTWPVLCLQPLSDSQDDRLSVLRERRCLQAPQKGWLGKETGVGFSICAEDRFIQITAVWKGRKRKRESRVAALWTMLCSETGLRVWEKPLRRKARALSARALRSRSRWHVHPRHPGEGQGQSQLSTRVISELTTL